MYSRRRYTWGFGFLSCSYAIWLWEMLCSSETVVGFRIETDEHSAHSWKDIVQVWEQGSSFYVLCISV